MQTNYEIDPSTKQAVLEGIKEHRFLPVSKIEEVTGLRKRHLIGALEGEPSIEYMIDQEGYRYRGDDDPITEEEIVEMLGEED